MRYRRFFYITHLRHLVNGRGQHSRAWLTTSAREADAWLCEYSVDIADQADQADHALQSHQSRAKQDHTK